MVRVRLPRLSGLMLLLLAGPAPLAAQEDSLARIALMEVARVGDVAQWLTRYDAVAWISSDSVIAQPDSLKSRLGPEWFVDTTAGLWHAYYGRYDRATDTYSIAFHFAGDRARNLKSSIVPVDTARVTASARAIYNSRSRLPAAFSQAGLALNWFVRRPTPDTIEVLYLPAYQQSGVLIFGGEASYRWDATGRQLLDSTYSLAGFRGIRPDTSVELVIPAEEHEYPSVGNLFFLLNYHRSFRSVLVRSRRVVTSVVVGADGPAFVTSVRERQN